MADPQDVETVPSAVDTATDAHMGGERLHAGIQPGKHDRPPRSVSSVEEQQHHTLQVACATHARSTLKGKQAPETQGPGALSYPPSINQLPDEETQS